MCPCEPLDLTLPDPPPGPSIPGFGNPFAVKLPANKFSIPEGFPEDLLGILDRLQLLLPPGVVQPALSYNYGKDIYDGIMKLMDIFYPFLMMYKFFLPLLNLVICILEVLCSLVNPFAIRRKVRRLFRKCLPEFLNLFPIFAMIIMLISLLLLLIELILYIIDQILKIIELLLRNIRTLVKAVKDANEEAILAIAVKLAHLLCIFQNIFVLLSLFLIFIQVIKDILNLAFAIPPCDDGSNGDASDCCTPDVCPEIIRDTPFERATGKLQYFNNVILSAGLSIPGFERFGLSLRPEVWELYDPSAPIGKQFIEINGPHDAPDNSFFPEDATYTAKTSPKNAAYTVDLKVFYNPVSWGRVNPVEDGYARYVIFDNCIVTQAPTNTLMTENGQSVSNNDSVKGVFRLAGGLGREEDGSSLFGYAEDGVTKINTRATLENFFHQQSQVKHPTNTSFDFDDGYLFNDVSYIFKPNKEVLYQKMLITIGCDPSVTIDKRFTNTVFGGDIQFRLAEVRSLLDDPNGPLNSLQTSISCLNAALAKLRTNMTEVGVAQFKLETDACLNKLLANTKDNVGRLVSIGFDRTKSTFTVTPSVQFTTQSIAVTVDLKDNNNTPLTSRIPTDLAIKLAEKLKAQINFGEISNFVYDGSRYFVAQIRSREAGEGVISISFDNKVIAVVNIPDNLDEQMTITNTVLPYKFVYAPAVGGIPPVPPVGEGDASEGLEPRRDAGDIAREGN